LTTTKKQEKLKGRRTNMIKAKGYLEQMDETREGQTFTMPSITEQKGWLSPGNQLRRLQEAGERLAEYRLENYDEYYFGDEEPSLDPIRTAEDLQDELLIIKGRMDKYQQANKRVKEALSARQKKEAEIAEKQEAEKAEKLAKRAADLAKKTGEKTEETTAKQE
jgi:hypothetical protein